MTRSLLFIFLACYAVAFPIVSRCFASVWVIESWEPIASDRQIPVSQVYNRFRLYIYVCVSFLLSVYPLFLFVGQMKFRCTLPSKNFHVENFSGGVR